jgi:two-component system NtrC family response regulator
MNKPTLLVVDDHEHILKQVKWALSEDFEVYTAVSQTEALETLRKLHPALMSVDLALGPGVQDRRAGFEVLQAALRDDPLVKAIVITSDQEEATAMQALRIGAFDYFVKPLPLDELRAALKRAAYLADLERRANSSADDPGDESGIVGESPVIVALRQRVQRVAETGFTALILGESGVGKELVAQAVARLSARRDGPFVVVNCAAIPENLLESELFGHEKGSFTGAYAQKKGKFELADSGTLFLDEIGDLSPGLQAKLLRFLQERTIERVGGTRLIHLDVRVIAATNRNLERDVREKLFREDLYYRLRVLLIRVPPLRERGDDVLVLANYFLARLASELGTPCKRLNTAAESTLKRHDWPGNVRELQNVIGAATVTSSRTIITPEALDLAPSDAPRDLRAARDQLERELIERALWRNNGVISRAARELGISRVTLYDLLNKHGVRSLAVPMRE